jgi:tRNA nucleotidyltransferase (CCA-adding enzyme)
MNIPSDIYDIHSYFNELGYNIYIVGGAVRDYIIDKNIIPNDFDLVTDAIPDKVIEILSKNNYRCDLQGVHFGVVRVFTEYNPDGYEIASYRRDIVPSRGNTRTNEKKVEIGSHITIKEDVMRRDFSINSLFYNISNHTIIDIVGGVDDIKNKIIRCNGIPSERFNEDRLRILRALRYASILNAGIHTDTSCAIMRDNRLFGISEEDDVSKERIFAEFIKVKEKADTANDPTIIKRFIDYLVDYGIMQQIFPVSVYEKNIKPTLNLSIAIAQVLRNNTVDENFKNTLLTSKIPIKYVDTICVLLKIYNGVNDQNFYYLHKEMKSKSIDIELIREWVNIMNIEDVNVKAFLEYDSSVTGFDVMNDGFKGQGIGIEILRREREIFNNLVNSI